MKLVYDETQVEVQIDDQVTTFRGEVMFVDGIQKPHKPSSEGRIYLRETKEKTVAANTVGYYPSVVGASWIEREDQ